MTFIVWHRISSGADSLHGVAFTLASLASIVAGTILFKLLAPKGSLWLGNGIQSLSGGLVLAPFAFTLSSVGDIVPSARLLAAFAFLVLGGSVLAYLLWFHLLKVCGATAASAYHFLMPPLGMLFAWMVLGEHVAIPRPARDRSGRARYLSGDAAGHEPPCQQRSRCLVPDPEQPRHGTLPCAEEARAG